MQVKFENGVVQLDIATLAEDEAVAREVAKHALTEEVLLTAFAQLAVDGSIEWSEFRLTGRDSLCPDGAAFVSTMPPSPSGVPNWAGSERKR